MVFFFDSEEDVDLDIYNNQINELDKYSMNENEENFIKNLMYN